MFNRPRCRDWSPLATQQLRLRNLIQITGHNIKAEPRSFIYYTLHLTPMSAPFFTSEKLETHNNAIWPDINCQSIVKSAARSVCIRIWQSYVPQYNHLKCVKAIETNESSNCVNDKIIFAWNVYLSGLIPISKRTDVKLNENSLIFHIHGGFFTAVDCLIKESIANQLYYVFYDYKQTSHQLLPQYEANVQDQYASALNSFNLNRNSNNLVLSSGTSAYTLDTTASETIDTHVPRYLLSRECNRHLNGDKKDEYIYVTGDTTTQTKENYSDGSSDYLTPYDIDGSSLKVRFLEKNFYKLEIRRSYNVDKLLLLQEKQRKFKYKSENAKEVMDKICMKSAFCLNLELITNKAMLYRPRVNPSMGRTLNRLLFVQPDQPKPEVLLQAQELRRRIEAAKFRCRFLAQERKKYKTSLQQLKVKTRKYSDENLEKECALMASYRGLSKNRELANEQHLIYLRQREMFSKILDTIFLRQKQLLHQLKDIYFVDNFSDSRRLYKINDVYLPNAYAYVDGSNDSDAVITPTSLCVALGYVAHIVQLCSSILNIPLRCVKLLRNICLIANSQVRSIFISETKLFTKALLRKCVMI